MVALFVLLPLLIMITIAIFDWFNAAKAKEYFGVVLCAAALWGLLLVELRDSLNYHLDESRIQITQAVVLDSRVEKHRSRLPVYLKVKLSDSEDMNFKFRSNTKYESFVKPKTVSLTYGKGFFNRPYVANVKAP